MPRTDVFVAREDIAVAIDEGDVDGIGHKTRMDRRAAWKRHDERQAVGGNRTPSQHAAQAHDKRLRDRGHMTTPGRHGSTVTARSCDNVVGAPSGTPAMLREVGHGS